MQPRSTPVNSKFNPRACKLSSKGSLERQERKNMIIELSCRRELNSDGCKDTKNRPKRRQVALGVRLGGPSYAQEEPSCAWSVALGVRLGAPSCDWSAAWRRQVKPKRRPRGPKSLPRAAMSSQELTRQHSTTTKATLNYYHGSTQQQQQHQRQHHEPPRSSQEHAQEPPRAL